MPMPVVVGCMAEEVQRVTGNPTGVSIATSESGNYNNSVYSTDTTGGQTILLTTGASTSPSIISANYDTAYGLVATSGAYILCWLRATDGLSYSTTGAINSSSLSNGCYVTWTANSYPISQDNTIQSHSNSGIGHFTINHGGGRNGYLTPNVNDTVAIKINGYATNRNGQTNATQVIYTYTWV